jgi:hypothetical protein
MQLSSVTVSAPDRVFPQTPADVARDADARGELIRTAAQQANQRLPGNVYIPDAGLAPIVASVLDDMAAFARAERDGKMARGGDEYQRAAARVRLLATDGSEVRAALTVAVCGEVRQQRAAVERAERERRGNTEFAMKRNAAKADRIRAASRALDDIADQAESGQGINWPLSEQISALTAVHRMY